MSKKPQLSGRDKVFRITRPLDVFHKYGREFGALDAALRGKDDFSPVCDHAINLAVSGWHLCDWVAAEIEQGIGWAEASSALGYHMTKDRHLQQFARDNCTSIEACQQIATAFKHVNMDAKWHRPDIVTFEMAQQDSANSEEPWQITVAIGGIETDMREVANNVFDFWWHTLGKLGMVP